VVGAMQDPNPLNSGGGFERLRAANIEILCGVIEDDARRLNEAFACWIRTKKPFVTLKSALTLDGQLALPKREKRGRSTWVTSEESRAQVHRMRHASDALLTGIGTVLTDDPLLTDRSGLSRRRRLLRVVLDTKLRLPVKSRIVQTAEDDLVVFTAATLNSPKARRLQKEGVELVRAKATRGRINLNAVLTELGGREILSLLLEAGPTLNGAALSASLVHKLMLFYAPKFAGDVGVPFAHMPSLEESPLPNLRVEQFGPDIAIEVYLRDVYRS
jgi:diaminohydroxyphosphoribosylaminopyrimidine deaminase / 5-amino-6-(5-phosphoribosylamino)uracil reductase